MASLTIPQQLRKHAFYRPRKIAVIDRDRQFTYRQFDRMVDGCCHALDRAGIGFGALIGVALNDRAEHLVMLLALGRLGATILPLDPRWQQREIEEVARYFEASLILWDGTEPRDGWVGVADDWYGESDAEWEDERVTLDTPMILSLSSGTTGMPKGPCATHGKFIARFMLYWIDLELGARDRFVTATPLYFGGGRGFALAMIYAGGTSLLFCPPYETSALIEFVNRHGGTATFLVPTLLRRALKDYRGARPAFPTIRVLISSGSAIFPEEQRMVRDRLTPNLFQYYSSTEGGGCSVLRPDDFEAHPASIGQPCFGVDVQIVDDQHRPLAAGESGLMRYRSEASADTFHKGDASAAFVDGWFYPGDLGSFDEDGYLHLRGRAKDMIIRGGVNIYPNDIEAVLSALPEVKEVAVAGVPSPDLGEEVVAFVVPAGPPDENALHRACMDRLARYKIPSRFVFVAELPKAGVGKVDKKQLIAALTESVS